MNFYDHLAKFIEVSGGRTFLLTAGCGIMCTLLVWNQKIDPATFALVLGGTVGTYIAANAYQKVKAPDNSTRSD